MKLPEHLPGLRWATIVVAIYGVIWIALEGDLLRVTLLGCAVALLLAGALFERWLAGRIVSLGSWIALCGALGTISGFSAAVLTLIFMAVKTGLHAHGPEFPPAQIEWVLDQMPWWTTAGLLAGVGLGSIYAVARRS